MITNQKIIDAVNKAILDKYPGSTFYIQNTPENFERPSFFIELVTDNTSGVNISTVEGTLSLQIVYFAPVNVYRIADAKDQLAVTDEIKNIFKRGYIQVEDRAIKVIEITGGPRNNEVYISVTLTYHETRPMETEDYDLMGEIQIKQDGRY